MTITATCDKSNIFTHDDPALCSTLVIRPRLNSAKSYFFPKSGLSYVFVHNLMIYDHFLSTVWVFWTKKFKKGILDSILNWVLF